MLTTYYEYYLAFHASHTKQPDCRSKSHGSLGPNAWLEGPEACLAQLPDGAGNHADLPRWESLGKLIAFAEQTTKLLRP